MKRLLRAGWFFITGPALLMWFSCSSGVLVPPTINLQEYGTIGMITFTSNAEGNLNEYLTQEFLETVQKSQPGVRVLEIGTMEKALRTVGYRQMDLDAIKAVGKQYNVETILTGYLEVSDIRPEISYETIPEVLGIRAAVSAAVTAKLYESEQGATLWTNTSRDRQVVANVTKVGSEFFFNAGNQKKAYGKLIRSLVEQSTRDFRPHREKAQ